MPLSIFVRPDGEADIVAQGDDGSLMYYWAVPGGTWSSTQVPGPPPPPPPPPPQPMAWMEFPGEQSSLATVYGSGPWPDPQHCTVVVAAQGFDPSFRNSGNILTGIQVSTPATNPDQSIPFHCHIWGIDFGFHR
jgi:hypothetical protein